MQNLSRKHPPHPLPHFSSGSCCALAARVPHAMSSCVVTSSSGSKRLSPGSERLLARARVARQDNVQIIGPSGNFHTEGMGRDHLHGPLLPLLDGYRPWPEAGSSAGGSKLSKVLPPCDSLSSSCWTALLTWSRGGAFHSQWGAGSKESPCSLAVDPQVG